MRSRLVGTRVWLFPEFNFCLHYEIIVDSGQRQRSAEASASHGNYGMIYFWQPGSTTHPHIGRVGQHAVEKPYKQSGTSWTASPLNVRRSISPPAGIELRATAKPHVAACTDPSFCWRTCSLRSSAKECPFVC